MKIVKKSELLFKKKIGISISELSQIEERSTKLRSIQKKRKIWIYCLKQTSIFTLRRDALINIQKLNLIPVRHASFESKKAKMTFDANLSTP